MRKVVHGAWMLAVAVSLAGCASTTAISAVTASDSPGLGSSASVQPSGSKTAVPPAASVAVGSLAPATAGALASAPALATAAAVPSAATAGPLGLLAIAPSASPWTDNTNARMGLDAFIAKFYDPDSQAGEKSLYTQRGFVSGAFEGWFNLDGSQQTIAIARFASASGAISAFDDLSNSLRENPAPSTAFTDAADGAVGSADPKLDSQGNAYIDVTAHVGDYLVDVHEFSAATPDTAAAKALLLKQVEAIKRDS
jgi:hypothetical protein